MEWHAVPQLAGPVVAPGGAVLGGQPFTTNTVHAPGDLCPCDSIQALNCMSGCLHRQDATTVALLCTASKSLSQLNRYRHRYAQAGSCVKPIWQFSGRLLAPQLLQLIILKLGEALLQGIVCHDIDVDKGAAFQLCRRDPGLCALKCRQRAFGVCGVAGRPVEAPQALRGLGSRPAGLCRMHSG